MTVSEAVRCRIQGILWDRFRELICVPNHREGHLRWRRLLENNAVRTLGGVDFRTYNRGQEPFVAVSCPQTPNACLMVPMELAEKMLLFGTIPD